MPNWSELLKEIRSKTQEYTMQAQGALDEIRRKYLKTLHEYTKRNIITYYSGWLSKPEIANLCSITDEDKNGFMMAIHKMDKKIGLDLILHTPGGDIASTESIVHYVRSMFGDNIRAIVPQIAMSADTMIACSCKSILMCKHSNLGPIDPQVASMPAHGIIKEFATAYDEIKNDPIKVNVWGPIISKYPPTFLSQCENAIKWSEEFVKKQLTTVMFKEEEDAEEKSSRIVEQLTDYTKNKTHARHIHIEECKKIGLKIENVEDDNRLQDLLLPVHHCYMHCLMNAPAYKIIENHFGTAFVKQISAPLS